MADFKLSAQLVGHDSDVRAVTFARADAVLTTSRDKSIRAWQRTSKSPPAYEANILTVGAEYINSLAYLPPSADHPEGLVISGGKDAIIDVRKPTSQPGDQSSFLMVGHTGNVCTLDIMPGGKHIVSGGWDGQARVWNVSRWETEVQLVGHGEGEGQHNSVLAVLAYDQTTVITGCADGMIRRYDLRMSKKKKDGLCQPANAIRTPDAVRALCRLPDGHATGAFLASASNDGIIRLWRIDGSQVAELHGHESYVYSLACLPTGELVSSGEDRTVRIWKGTECAQTITHPAISVWSVSVCKETGDIVSGASDNIARIFTRAPDRHADAQTLSQFSEAVKTSAIPQQQMPAVNKEQLPGPEFLQSKSGTKDGQTVMIKEADGSVTAHMWSNGEQRWNLVGTVVDGGASGSKVDYQGQSYDYVFDVDIEDGKPPLKLPYNLSEGPYDAARKFLENNNLPITYLESVARFISENAKGATLETSTGYTQTTDAAPQRPVEASTTLPDRDFLLLAQAKLEPIQRKITQLNSDLINAGQKDYALNPTELTLLDELARQLTDGLGKLSTSTPATAAEPRQPLQFSAHALGLVLKLATKWSYPNRLPGLDLLRCVSVSSDAARYRQGNNDDDDNSVLDLALASATETGGVPAAEPKVVQNSIMMAFRVVTNLFATQDGRALAAAKADKVVTLMECVIGASDSPVGQVQGPIGTDNRNVMMGLTTAAINYAVLALTERRSSKGSNSVGQETLALLLNVLGHVVQKQTDAEIVFRALAALGNILSIPGDDAYAETAKALGAADWVIAAKQNASEPRVRNLATVVYGLLK